MSLATQRGLLRKNLGATSPSTHKVPPYRGFLFVSSPQLCSTSPLQAQQDAAQPRPQISTNPAILGHSDPLRGAIKLLFVMMKPDELEWQPRPAELNHYASPLAR